MEQRLSDYIKKTTAIASAVGMTVEDLEKSITDISWSLDAIGNRQLRGMDHLQLEDWTNVIASQAKANEIPQSIKCTPGDAQRKVLRAKRKKKPAKRAGKRK